MDKKRVNEILKVGDVICVKKKWDLFIKTIVKANGGIVVMDPFSGRVLALSGVLVLKKVNLIEPPKH